MPRYRYSWNIVQLAKLDKVKEVLNQYRNYWPLTLRQVYYQLVSKQFIENKDTEYKMLSQLLKWARIDGHIPWNAIEDRVRAVHSYRGFDDKDHFIAQELDGFLTGYHRNLVQSQDVFIEVWIEKDALSSIFSRVTKEYNISTVVCRGFSSVTFLNDFRNRVHRNGKMPIMLYFGDYDPSGLEMLPAMEKTLIDEMDVGEIQFKRIALTKKDIHDYDLPHDPAAVKKSDSRYKRFVQQYGEYAVELDALPPDVLSEKIKVAIENELDMDLFNEEMELENSDLNRISELRDEVQEYLNSLEI